MYTRGAEERRVADVQINLPVIESGIVKSQANIISGIAFLALFRQQQNGRVVAVAGHFGLSRRQDLRCCIVCSLGLKIIRVDVT